jgi:hypothetical protein
MMMERTAIVQSSNHQLFSVNFVVVRQGQRNTRQANFFQLQGEAEEFAKKLTDQGEKKVKVMPISLYRRGR